MQLQSASLLLAPNSPKHSTYMHPSEIKLNRERTHIAVTWETGSIAILPAATLRRHARDASSVRRMVSGGSDPAAADITITSVEPIGNYAIRLAFSDGHDRGIFPWDYLAEIAGEQSSSGDMRGA